MVKLRISADDEEGTLQRAIFEFSKRNIPIEGLFYRRETGGVTMQFSLNSEEDAQNVLRNLSKIYGVRNAEIVLAKEGEIFGESIL
ncbi:MAG: hypothetical protein M1476_00415 [Candidatus Thermoplasmatota archaeon]|nr:hypothetical protein [Candidatus Thermoplasmatota archaeon]